LLHLRRGFGSSFSLDSNQLHKEKPKVVILGTGWSAHALSKIIDTDMFNIVCISPRPYFVFTPMLAASALGTVEHRSIIEPTRSSNPLIQYIQGTVIDINPNEKEVFVKTSLRASSSPFILSYDYLIYGVGANVADFGLKTVHKYCNFIKEIEDVIKLKQKILTCFEAALLPDSRDEDIDRLLTFVTIGAGPTGVEFTGELADFVEEKSKKLYPQLRHRVKIVLIDANKSILGAFDTALQSEALKSMQARGVEVMLTSRVTEIQEDAVFYKSLDTDNINSNECKIDYGVCVWAAGTAPRPLSCSLAEKLGTDVSCAFKRTGRLPVDPWLRLKGVPTGSVFAMGDCALINTTNTCISKEGVWCVIYCRFV